MKNTVKAPSETEDGAEKKRSKKKSAKSEKERELEPLKEAAGRIAKLLCEFSGERELFISDGEAPSRRLDTKALKEFSAVLKEVSAVVAELNGEGEEMRGGVHIEFSSEVSDFCN